MKKKVLDLIIYHGMQQIILTKEFHPVYISMKISVNDISQTKKMLFLIDLLKLHCIG